MANKWFYLNYATLNETTATVSVATANSFYPVSNLKHNHTVKEFRTQDSEATVNVTFDFGVAKTVDSFLMVGNNATAQLNVSSVQILGNPTDTWATPAYDSGVLTLTPDQLDENFFYKAVTSTSARYWRITFTNTGGANNFVGLSNIFLGPATTMSLNAISYGWQFQRIDRSVVQEGRYGQRYVDRINDQKAISGSFEFLNKDEFETIDLMFQYCGVHTPLWLIVDSDEVIVNNANVYSGYFNLIERPSFTNRAYGLMSTDFSLIEVV